MKAMLAAVVLAQFAIQAPAEAQQSAKIARVGFLAPQGRSLPLFDAFRQGLAELGYVEGRNIVIEPRFAEGTIPGLKRVAVLGDQGVSEASLWSA